MSDCLQAMSKTRSKVKEPWASFDYSSTSQGCLLASFTSNIIRKTGGDSRSERRRVETYVDRACVCAIEADDRLATRLILDPVLRPEAGDDLDAICRHGCAGCSARDSMISWTG